MAAPTVQVASYQLLSGRISTSKAPTNVIILVATAADPNLPPDLRAFIADARPGAALSWRKVSATPVAGSQCLAIDAGSGPVDYDTVPLRQEFSSRTDVATALGRIANKIEDFEDAQTVAYNVLTQKFAGVYANAVVSTQGDELVVKSDTAFPMGAGAAAVSRRAPSGPKRAKGRLDVINVWI